MGHIGSGSHIKVKQILCSHYIMNKLESTLYYNPCLHTNLKFVHMNVVNELPK